VTPIPLYEPAREVFTPPREVTVTPTISKSSKRKSVGGRSINPKAKEGGGTADKAKGKRKTLKVLIPSTKNELPNVDLNTSMPPASPSDDPLLLSGPVVSDGDSGPTLMIFVDLDQERLILIQRPNLRGPILLIWMKTVFLSLVIERIGSMNRKGDVVRGACTDILRIHKAKKRSARLMNDSSRRPDG